MMTTVYRAITREDTLAVTEYALRVLREAAQDEPLHVAPLKVRDAVAFFANKGQGHFNLAAFEDKKVVGALALYVGEMPFFERCEGSVYFCHASVPGVGFRLIGEMMAWVRADLRIRRVQWLMNKGETGDRMGKAIARRYGFDAQRLETLVFFK
jgi:hypothetical protein